MKARNALRLLPFLLGLLMSACPLSVHACATCFGRSDSPLAQGMNWGIFTLLVIVALVLGGVTAFFIFMARRSTAGPNGSPSNASRSQLSD